MSSQIPKISLVVPVHNEAGNLKWHQEKILEFFSTSNYSWEILYIDDGSTDSSFEIIQEISRGHQNIRYVKFSRNFGKEAATTAGLRKSLGEAVIMIDADGQHPVRKMSELISEWEKGYEVVIGVRNSVQKSGIIKRAGSVLFNKTLSAISDTNTVRGSTDFRLLDRKVVDAFNTLTEHNRITRGLVDWLGFKRTYIYFDAPERHSGKASYSITKLFGLAMHAFVSQSTKPLQFTGFLGLFVMLLSGTAGIFILVEGYLLGDPMNLKITGSAIVAVFLSFLVGLVLICQWLLALYVESIHTETLNRPLYIVDKEKTSN